MRIRLINSMKWCFEKYRLCPKSITLNNMSNSSNNYSVMLEKHKSNLKADIPKKAMSVFEGKSDRYNGITVSSDEEKCDPAEFSNKLEESLKTWVDEKKRCIWFKVKIEDSDWIPILAKNGFKYHHAKSDSVLMYKWLPVTEHENLPPYAHTNIGVGGLVVNEKSQVLVLKENYFHFKVPNWKFPGGYVEPGENFVDAAIREVLEETNIKTEFVSLLSLRHAHNAMFDCSDLFIVVHLKPLDTEIKKDDREIMECKWMDIEEFLTHPDTHELNRFFLKKYLEHRDSKIKIGCDHKYHELMKKPYTIYHALKEK